MNSSPRRVVLALGIGALCVCAVGACGGDSSTKASVAAQLLDQTFKATSASLRNGRVDARLQLEPKGLLAIGGPISLDAKGPFVLPRGDGLARFDLAGVVTVAGQRYDAGALSDGRQAFLKLDGRSYRLGDKRSSRTLASLTLDPRRWIEGEQRKGDARIGGIETTRVTGTLDAARLLEDLDALVPAKLGDRIADAVKSADVEVWAGTGDKILRQLVVRIAFEVAKGAEPPIPGLEAGTIALRVRLADVNAEPARIKAPARALALSKVPADRGLGGLIECLGKIADSGAELASCVTTLDP